MELSTRVKQGSFLELTIKTDSTQLVIDLTEFKNKNWVVPENLIEQLITVANDCSRFNVTTDLDFVHTIAESFLNEYETEQLINRLTQ